MEVWGGNRATWSQFSVSGLDLSVQSEPFRSSDGGGDVYYLSSCASGRITRMLLADVGGHARLYLDRGTKLDHLRMMCSQGVSSLQSPADCEDASKVRDPDCQGDRDKQFVAPQPPSQFLRNWMRQSCLVLQNSRVYPSNGRDSEQSQPRRTLFGATRDTARVQQRPQPLSHNQALPVTPCSLLTFPI